MMYHYNDTLCISGSSLIKSGNNPQGLLSKSYYDKLSREKKIDIKRKGCFGTPALISIDSLPNKYQLLIREKIGSPAQIQANEPFFNTFCRDAKAVEFFTAYRLADGRALPPKIINRYVNDASILNTFKTLISNTNKHKAIGAEIRSFWAKAVQALKQFDKEVDHSLPQSKDRLQATYKRYVAQETGGYEKLVSRKFMNDNSRKVTAMVEKMLLSIYAMPNKPFAASVHEIYLSFLDGRIEIVDKSTGAFFERADFQSNGQPIHISESTVWNYLNNPLNRALVDKSRLDQHEFNNVHRPHANRHAPKYSFSKISMDDRDLPRKLAGGDRVKAYYAYDVASGAVVGKAYSRTKDEELFLECLRDMFRLIDVNNWGVPMEVEVENHLVNKFFDDLGLMFPIVRICAPGNSQEKSAEHFNRSKKYGVEKTTQQQIGRWWAKGEAYRVKSHKVNDAYVEPAFTFENILADDLAAVKAYNNQLHPRQKRYPNMTRWEVLCNHINPQLPQINRAVWIKSIGNHTVTSIKRSKYVSVQYKEYELPNPAIISRLKPNNYQVDAYWLKNEFGEIEEVFLYQSGVYLCKALVSKTFNQAKSEWTANDQLVFAGQSAYTAQFDQLIKLERMEKVIKPELIPIQGIMAMTQASCGLAAITEKIQGFDLEQEIEKYSGGWMIEKGVNNI